MKRIILISIFTFAICNMALPQKLTGPKLLGNIVAWSEDPSEFLLHTVMEQSEMLLKENSQGKLIIRLCSNDDFPIALIKAQLKPSSASAKNKFSGRIIFPDERIFIAKYSKCVERKNFVNSQYWFVPDETSFEYEEIFPEKGITYNNFYVDDDADNKTRSENFAANIKEFIAELRADPTTKGFIVHNSKNRRIKNNIEKVYQILKDEKLDLQRVKTIVHLRLVFINNVKLKSITDETTEYPRLVAITTKQQ